MNIITIDFETFYSKDYDLKRFGTEGYIRDPQFEVIGVGVKVNNSVPMWLDVNTFRVYTRTVDWANVAVLAHHAHFDGLILSHHFGIRPGFWLDTLSMGRLVHTVDVGGSLAKLAAYYHVGEKGNEVIQAKGKRLADFTRADWEQYGEYCKNDCNLTWDIFHAILEWDFPESELHLIDMTVRMFTEPTFVLDLPMLEAYLIEERARKQALLDRIGQDKEVLMSNDKFALLLMELGVDEPPRKMSKRTGKETWAFAKSDPGMQALLEHEEDNVRWAAEARVGVKSTINESRTERLLRAGAGGRPIPIYLNYHRAHTGRWSGGDKQNAQNWERTDKKDPNKGRIRKSIRVIPGKALVVADQAQIEARGLAWFAGDDPLVEAFAQGRDVYSEFATTVYGRTITKADELERFVGKTATLGLGYALGWLKFAMTMAAAKVIFTWKDIEVMGVDVEAFAALTDKYGVTNRDKVEEMPSRLPVPERMVHCAVAKRIVDRYREQRVPITETWEGFNAALSCMLEGCDITCGPNDCIRLVYHGVELPSGRKLRYPGLSAKQDMFGDWVFSYMGGRVGKDKVHIYGGSLTENVIQALARDVIADQMTRIRMKYGYHIATTTHDEIVLVVNEQEAETAFKNTLAEMKIPPAWAAGWPVKAEGGWGQCYGEVK